MGRTKEAIERIKQPNKLCGLVVFPDVDIDDLDYKLYDQMLIKYGEGYGGHTRKTYLRVDSKYFEDAFKEMRINPNCGFITNINNVVKDGVVPEKVSVLVKEYMTSEDIKREGFATSVLNFYGIPTCVNVLVKNPMKKEIKFSHTIYGRGDEFDRESELNYHMNMSLDFIGENDELHLFSDLIDYTTFLYGPFDRVYADMTSAITKILYRPPFNSLPEDKKSQMLVTLAEQLVKSFLVRGLVCNDFDFSTDNIGLIVNEKDLTIRLINFDFEYTFDSTERETKFKRFLDECRDLSKKAHDDFVAQSQELFKNLINSTVKEKDIMADKPKVDGVLITLKHVIEYDNELKRQNESPSVGGGR